MVLKNKLQRLCQRLGYAFNNFVLLEQALTHRSAAVDNNERLEFLGDAVLSFVMTNALFLNLPQESEGQLSRLRASLVNGDKLAELALQLQLGECLILGVGELRSGGFRRASILADALEAIIGAVFLDGGIEASKALVLRLYAQILEDAETLRGMGKDAKTALQEFLQAKKCPLPKYVLSKQSGDAHEQIFHISCSVKGIPHKTEGSGPNRRKAEQEAAEKFLLYLRSMDV